jgi:hypothetical protein
MKKALRKAALRSLLILPVGQLSTQTTIFVGPPGGVGDVLMMTETADVRPPELQGILLLPIECIGRTSATELRADLARLRSDIPGANRLSLPSQTGSLYKFRRATALGGANFGYFVVTPQLEVRCVLEVRGTGPLQIDDPIPGKVAISAAGTALLTATTPEAGGNVLEVDLVAGCPVVPVDRTNLIEELDFSRNGLFLAEEWGFALTPTGAYRFDRTVDAPAEAVMFAELPAWFGPDVVASADGSTVAFAAGDDPTRAHIYVCRSTGPASRATQMPGPVAGAGFLPEDTLGPALALSTDGSHVAWCTSGAWTECFARETGATHQADVQVTRDDLFDDTLNETGVISFFDPDSFVFTVGWRDGSELARADVYRADMGPSGALSVTNLTGTSGLLVPPFDYGTLATAAGIRQTPDGQGWLTLDPGLGRLLWIDSSGQAVEFLGGVTSIELLEPAGDYLVAAVHRFPSADNPDGSLDLVQIPAGGGDATILVAPKGSTILHSQGWQDRNLFAAILDLGAGEWLGRITVPSSTGLLMSNQVRDYGLTHCLTQDGSIKSSLAFGAGQVYFEWTAAGTDPLRATRNGFVLPGI